MKTTWDSRLGRIRSKNDHIVKREADNRSLTLAFKRVRFFKVVRRNGQDSHFVNVTVGYCNGGDAGHPAHGACYGTLEGRGRREKGRAVAGGARGARGKNVGTGLCRFLVIKFLKCNRFIYHTASWTLFEISKASHNVHIVGYPHMHSPCQMSITSAPYA